MLCGNAEFDTKRFSFVDVYMFCVVPVITGMVGVLGSELSSYRYENYLISKLGQEALAKANEKCVGLNRSCASFLCWKQKVKHR